MININYLFYNLKIYLRINLNIYKLFFKDYLKV
jgi:hypothetical protein